MHPARPRSHQLALESGATLISVGHRPSLTKFHSRVLQLGLGQGGGGGWRVCSAEEYAAEAASAAPAPVSAATASE
jgi:ABC-type uncharacterized transport system fused permease/ATPase subunit